VHSSVPGVLVEGAYGHFTTIGGAWNVPAVGYGTFTYDTATGLATWAENGDSAGSSVQIDALYDNWVNGDGSDKALPNNGRQNHILFSANGNALDVHVKPWLLPTSGGVITVETFCVTALRTKTQMRYPWVNGNFTSYPDPDNPPPIEQPAPPSAPGVPTFVSNTETSITFSYTAATPGNGAAITGYKIYRDAGAGMAHIDTIGVVLQYEDITAVDGVDYTYQVSALDNWTPPQEGTLSTESAVMNTAASGGQNEIYPESEFTDYVTCVGDNEPENLWDEGGQVVATFVDGILVLTANSTSQNGDLLRSFACTNGNKYKLHYKARKGSADCKLMCHSSNVQPLNGDLFDIVLNNTDFVEGLSPEFTATSDVIHMIIRVNYKNIGRYVESDFVRLLDTT
jgi:hypothetical protein